MRVAPSPGVNDSRDEYECAACGKTFASEQELQRHVKDVGLVD
jgi:uncharacterized membrane protein YvbJ